MEFKRKAVELSYARGNVSEVCRIGYSQVYAQRWSSVSRTYGQNSFPSHGHTKLTDDQKEIVRLKKQLQDAELERDILKKTISTFSVSDKRNLDL